MTPKTSPTGAASAPTPFQTQPAVPQAQLSFQVSVPQNTPAGQNVILAILDEITGLPFNTTSYQMKSMGNGIYELKLPFPLGSVVNYRYELNTSPRTNEFLASGVEVRYRVAVVHQPEVVQDVVSSWSKTPSAVQTGEIKGQVVDNQANTPLSGLMVFAGGAKGLTGADGKFDLVGLPEGLQNLVVLSPDGKTQPFQQGARVVSGKITQATVPVAAARMVTLTFQVTPPKENVIGLPIRIAGNLTGFGDTFNDLAGGVSVKASRLPLLNQKPDGSYSFSVQAPSGTDLRYKYTLGDGFWNSELSADGKFLVRQLIVPEHDAVIQDQISTWRSPSLAPVTFEVQAPANTPASTVVSIQFSPLVWMEPLPMWALGNNKWIYILYSPQQLLGEVKYRFCQNDQCDAGTQGAPNGQKFKPSSQPQKIQKSISTWLGENPQAIVTSLVGQVVWGSGKMTTPDRSFYPNRNGRREQTSGFRRSTNTPWIYI